MGHAVEHAGDAEPRILKKRVIELKMAVETRRIYKKRRKPEGGHVIGQPQVQNVNLL